METALSLAKHRDSGVTEALAQIERDVRGFVVMVVAAVVVGLLVMVVVVVVVTRVGWGAVGSWHIMAV